eukprot:PhF_6_TR25542/c1_g2_i7/m.35844
MKKKTAKCQSGTVMVAPSLPPTSSKPHRTMPVDVLVIVASFLDLQSVCRCQRLNHAWSKDITPPMYVPQQGKCNVMEINTAKVIAEDVQTHAPSRCHVVIEGHRFPLERPKKCKERPRDEKDIEAECAKATLTPDVLRVLKDLPIHSLTMEHHCDANGCVFMSEAEWFDFFKSLPIERLVANHRVLFLHDTAWFSLPFLQDVVIGNESPDAVAELCLSLCPNIVSITIQGHWSSSYSFYHSMGQDASLIFHQEGLTLGNKDFPTVRHARIDRQHCNSLLTKFPNLVTYRGQPSWKGPTTIFHPEAVKTLSSVYFNQSCVEDHFHFLFQCMHMKRIEIYSLNNTDITGLSLQDITSPLLELTSVDLGSNCSITIEGLGHIARLAPNLKAFKLGYFDGDIKAAAKLFPKGCDVKISKS